MEHLALGAGEDSRPPVLRVRAEPLALQPWARRDLQVERQGQAAGQQQLARLAWL
jgi:hypothetical protein